MHTLKIETTNEPIEIIDASELTDEEQSQFDFLDWPAIQDGRDSASFFRFNDEVHYLGDFMRAESESPSTTGLRDWDGYRSDSFSNGMVVRFVDEFVIVGTYRLVDGD